MLALIGVLVLSDAIRVEAWHLHYGQALPFFAQLQTAIATFTRHG